MDAYVKAHAVFPTGVGMNRTEGGSQSQGAGVPHGRGDEPAQLDSFKSNPMCSPRAWG